MSITGEGLWWSLFYDCDTIFGIDNEGEMHFHPYYEFNDQEDGQTSYVYNGNRSLLFERLTTCFPNEIRQMYQSMRSGKWTRAKILENYDKNQLQWGERLFNENAYIKYLEPFVIDGDDTYFPMLLGDGRSHRHYFINNRIDYLDSKFNSGEALTNVATVRGYQSANISISYLTPMYCSIKYGSQLVQVRQKVAGTLTPVPIPAGMSISDTETYIYSAHKLTEISGLDAYQIGYADFTQATALRKLLIGKHSDDTYTNTHFSELKLGNNILLEEVDCAGCTNLSGNINVKNCTSLNKMYFDRTSITGITVPSDIDLGYVYVPNTIRTFYLKNNTCSNFYYNGNLMTDSNFSTLTQLSWVNSSINNVNIVNAILNLQAGCYTRVIADMRIENATDVTTFIDKIATLHGIDESGSFVDDAQFGGSLHINDYITRTQLALLQQYMPYVNITYLGLKLSVKIYNADMETFAYSQVFNSGETLPALSTYIPTYVERRIGSKHCSPNGGYFKIGTNKTIYESATWDSHKADLDGTAITDDIEIGGNFTESDITFKVNYVYYYQNVSNSIVHQAFNNVEYASPLSINQPASKVVDTKTYNTIGSHCVEASKNHIKYNNNPVTLYTVVGGYITVPFGDIVFKKTSSVGGYIYTGEVYLILNDDIVSSAYGFPTGADNEKTVYYDWINQFSDSALNQKVEDGKCVVFYDTNTSYQSSSTTFVSTDIFSYPNASNWSDVTNALESMGSSNLTYMWVTMRDSTDLQPTMANTKLCLFIFNYTSKTLAGFSRCLKLLASDKATHDFFGNKTGMEVLGDCFEAIGKSKNLFLNVGVFDTGVGHYEYNSDSSIGGTYYNKALPRLYVGWEYALRSNTYYATSTGTDLKSLIDNHNFDFSSTRTKGSYKFIANTYGILNVENGQLGFDAYDNSMCSYNTGFENGSVYRSGDTEDVVISLVHTGTRDTDYANFKFIGFVGFGTYLFVKAEYTVTLINGTTTEAYTYNSACPELCTYPNYTYPQISKINIKKYYIWDRSMYSAKAQRSSDNSGVNVVAFGTDQPTNGMVHVYCNIYGMFDNRSALNRQGAYHAETCIAETVCDKTRFFMDTFGSYNDYTMYDGDAVESNTKLMYSVYMSLYKINSTTGAYVNKQISTFGSIANMITWIQDASYDKLFITVCSPDSSVTGAQYFSFIPRDYNIFFYDYSSSIKGREDLWFRGEMYYPYHATTKANLISDIVNDINGNEMTNGTIKASQLYDRFKNVTLQTAERYHLIELDKCKTYIDEKYSPSIPQRSSTSYGSAGAVPLLEVPKQNFIDTLTTVSSRHPTFNNIYLGFGLYGITGSPISINGTHTVFSNTTTYGGGYRTGYWYSYATGSNFYPEIGAFPWCHYINQTFTYAHKLVKRTGVGNKEFILLRVYNGTVDGGNITQEELDKMYISLYLEDQTSSKSYIDKMKLPALFIPFEDVMTKHTLDNGDEIWEAILSFEGLARHVNAFLSTENTSVNQNIHFHKFVVNQMNMPQQYIDMSSDDRIIDYEDLDKTRMCVATSTDITGNTLPIIRSVTPASYTGTVADFDSLMYTYVS